jgi:hypothetical protein
MGLHTISFTKASDTSEVSMSSDNTYSMPPFKTILKQVVIRSRDLRKQKHRCYDRGQDTGLPRNVQTSATGDSKGSRATNPK